MVLLMLIVALLVIFLFLKKHEDADFMQEEAVTTEESVSVVSINKEEALLRWWCPALSFPLPGRIRHGGLQFPIPEKAPVLHRRIPGCGICLPGRKAEKYFPGILSEYRSLYLKPG